MLVVLSNGLFAAQMTVTMIEDATKAVASSEDKTPCHGDKAVASEKVMECCQGDCTGCVLSTSLSHSESAVLPNPPKSEKLIGISNHLLTAHTSNLYRPPILI